MPHFLNLTAKNNENYEANDGLNRLDTVQETI